MWWVSSYIVCFGILVSHNVWCKNCFLSFKHLGNTTLSVEPDSIYTGLLLFLHKSTPSNWPHLTPLSVLPSPRKQELDIIKANSSPRNQELDIIKANSHDNKKLSKNVTRATFPSNILIVNVLNHDKLYVHFSSLKVYNEALSCLDGCRHLNRRAVTYELKCVANIQFLLLPLVEWQDISVNSHVGPRKMIYGLTLVHSLKYTL